MTAKLEFVRKVWQDMLLRGGVERTLVPQLAIRSAQEGLVRANLEIKPEHTNRLGIVHGGVISVLVDIGGSLAVASKNRFMTGVTTDMSTTFISSGGKPGDILTIDCKLLKMGRTMAFTQVELFRDERLVASGSHTKYLPKE